MNTIISVFHTFNYYPVFDGVMAFSGNNNQKSGNGRPMSSCYRGQDWLLVALRYAMTHTPIHQQALIPTPLF